MRVGIVNDLPLAVEAIRRALSVGGGFEIAWVARDGAEAVEQCARDRPDVVLMDLIMPVMGGVEATRRIMSQTPCAILVVTVSVGSNVSKVYDAMGYGAFDAVDAPILDDADPARAAAPLLRKLKLLSSLLGDGGKDGNRIAPRRRLAAGRANGSGLLAVGASAGGPAALATLFSGLPRSFPAAIVVVQHVDAQFAGGLAQWLANQCDLPVRIAEEGDRPEPGEVLIAGTDDHLVIKSAGVLGYTPDPVEAPYRPSVDTFFESVVRHWRSPVVGALLTGMGRDGAVGLKALRQAGFHTIAQDRESCAIYGMSKAAVALDAAVEVLPLDRIAAAVTRRLTPVHG